MKDVPVQITKRSNPLALAAIQALNQSYTRESSNSLKSDSSMNIIQELNSRIASDCKTIDREERYRTFLDDTNEVVVVGGLSFTPSRVIEELDPIAFRCGVSDYEDSEGWVEVDGEYYDKSDCEGKKTELDDKLNADLSMKEEELEELEKTSDDLEDIKELKREIDEINAAIATLKSHSF